LLCSAERFNDSAIFLGLFFLKTLFSRSSALLCFVTFADHFFVAALFVDFFGPLFFYGSLFCPHNFPEKVYKNRSLTAALQKIII